MRNLHLILINKAVASLYHCSNTRDLFTTRQTPDDLLYEVYITSDEEIKEGDYWFDGTNVRHDCPSSFINGIDKKIILTTDENLIKDGVQAIDDEFLEWFVKNPSCEEVETKLVEFEVDMGLGDSCIEYGSYYKIIIPKEPKDVVLGYKTSLNAQMLDKNGLEEPKQETLEEAVYQNIGLAANPQGIINQALATSNVIKVLQKRMYSEEDMRTAFFSAIKSTAEGWNGEYANGNNPNVESKFNSDYIEWFEQYKKK